MFENFSKRIISGIIATVMAMSNISPVVSIGVWDEESDLTHQSIELYPNGEEAEQVVTLNGMMPDGAEAQAIDVTEEHDGILAYDITITDGDDEYQPGEKHPIFVEIFDPVIPESRNIQLWHIKDNGDRDRIYDFLCHEGKISFYATGFSVYEILKDEIDFKIDSNIVPVTGDTSSFDTYTVDPVGANVNFTYDVVTDNQPYPDVRGTAVQVSNLNDLQTFITSENGFYIQSVKNGFFAKNYQENDLKVSNGTGRTGIAITASFNTADSVANMFNAYNAGAAKFYFEKTAPNENYYYIYTYGDESDPETIKYVGHVSGLNRLYLTNDSNNTNQTAITKWTVGYDTTNSCFYFKDATQNWYWNETYEQPKPNYGFSSYSDNSSKDIGARFKIWLYTPVDFTTDPYGLGGNTYGLVNFKDAANGNALMAGNYNNGVTQLGLIPVKRAEDNGVVSYSTDYGITGWKFEWIEGTAKYKLSAIADDGAVQKYLKITSDGISLTADADEASEITVTPDSNNRIKLSTADAAVALNGTNSFQKGTVNNGVFFDLVDISSAPADSLGLDGQTYALINKQNDTTGSAMIAKADLANALHLDNQPIERSGNTYIYSGELSGWTFTNVDTNRYIISNGSKYLKLVKDSLTLSDEPFILTVFAGDGDNAGKIRILNTTDRYLIKSNGNTSFNMTSFNWQNIITNTDTNRWFELAELTTPPESDPFALDGKTYGIMNKVNNTTAYSMTYDLRTSSQLRGKKADCVSGEPKYKSFGAPVGWTFHWQGYANYKISVDTGGGIIKWLKFNSTGVSIVDESEATIFNVSAGTGDNAGKIRICPVLDNAISSIIRYNSGAEYFFQRGTATSPNGQYWHDLVNFSLNDPYKLDGKKLSLMHYISGANGHALTASDVSNSLNMTTCIVRPELGKDSKVLYAAMDTDITEWTFENAGEDKYYIYAAFGDTKKYLHISADSIAAEETETPQAIQVKPDEDGRIMLSADGYSVKYQANTENQNENGRFVSASGDGDYLYFVSQTEIEDDELITYKAKEISVSEVKNGEHVIIYTRVWNGNGYDFCAIDHNGNLVPCYERGDSIMWLSNKVNTMIWEFTEYYYEYTDTPNNYYDLYNPYSGKYIVPKRSSGMTLSDDPIGINLEGRRYGEYYSTILAWDQQSYAYSGLKADITGQVDGIDDKLATSARAKADTFYFARVVDYTNDLTEVKTVDNTQYGITMRMVNFKVPPNNGHSPGGTSTSYIQAEVMGTADNASTYIDPYTPNKLLSTNLGDDGFPIANRTNKSLAELFANTTSDQIADSKIVNHLFVQSILEQSGYFEFDSCQSFATLKNAVQSRNENGDFLYLETVNGKEVVKAYAEDETPPADAKPIYDFFVSKEIGTHDASIKSSLQHGQFFPYDDIDMDTYANEKINGLNLYDARKNELPDSDPRKYERLHLIEDPDYYFGMQLDASFTQTPDGKDDWGHDIIFEFTGDDDFWLYVDNELVIDLGGIHSAVGGSVNFATGVVKMEKKPDTNLRDVFVSNYREREMTDEQIITELEKYFDYNDSYDPGNPATINDFNSVFKDYTAHNMKIFFMERGAGASNLHMRFNLNYVTPGDVVMTKELTGSEDVDFEMVEYPFQIWYSIDEDEHGNVNTEHVSLLTPNNEYINVKYQNSTRDVIYQEKYTPPGSSSEYESVYFINPHQSVEIHFPENTTYYKIIECGINSSVYDHVYVNGVEVNGESTNVPGSPLPERKIYESDWKRVSDRTNVVFTNHVDPNALRPLFFQKKLYDANYTPGMEDAESHKITAEQDPTTFSFRLYLSNGLTNERTLTNMVKYRVISPNGKYCKWNTQTQQFDESQYTSSSNENDVNSLKYALQAIADNEGLTAEQKAARKEALLETITFETSINGQISEIRAWYTVEVPNIPVGVMFEVEERDSESERPLGYDRVQYERIEGTYLTVDGEKDNVGIIRASDTPQMNVINQRGYEVRTKKVWSDVDFALGHDDIYTALYVRNNQGGYTLAPADVHPVRILSAPNTEVRYFMKTLVSEKSLSDYQIFEVTLTGNNISVDENGYVTGYEGNPTIVSDGGFASIHATDRVNSDTSESIVFSELEYLDADHAEDWSNQFQFDSGVQLYGDETAIKAESIPNKLRGAEYLRTANASGLYDGELCRFKAGTAIEVYVAMDEDITPVPEWLNGWEKINDKIVTDSNTELKLYKKNFTKGNTVTLGKNGGSSVNNNYIVIAAPIYSYKTEYAKGDEINPVTIDGITYSARGDSITNIRQGGIVINLYEMGTRDEENNEYGNPLQGGVFTLKKGDEVIGSYTSDASGRITIMYSFEVGQEYTLIQTSAPGRYFGVPRPITFSVGSGDDPDITVAGNDEKWNDYHKPYVVGDQLVAYIDVYNKPFELKAVKVDSEDKTINLANVHFALYRGVNSVDGLIPDTTPIAGCENLVTDSDGVIPDVTEHLRDGTYFLRETQAAPGYKLFTRPIRFSIHEHDIVLFSDANGGSTITQTGQTPEGYSYEIVTSNSGVQLIKTDGDAYDCVLQIPNEKDTSDYYFDIEKIIFVDKNVHDSDDEQKFVFRVDRFDGSTTDFSDSNIQASFYVTLNCNQELIYVSDDNITFKSDDSDYHYDLYHTATDTTSPKYEFISSADSVKIKRTYSTDIYTFPAAIRSGRKTVHVSSEGIYRISEVTDWSSTDYDFWTGSNVYKGFCDSDKATNHITDGSNGAGNYVMFNVSDVKADQFQTESAIINGETVYRPTASFTNSETEYAYLSSQAYAENIIDRP